MNELSDMLPLYLTGDLSPDEEDRVEAALARSPELRRELVALGETLAELQRAGTDGDVSESTALDGFFDDQIAPQLGPARAAGTRFGSAWLRRAAAFVLAFGAGVLFARSDSTEAPEPVGARDEQTSPSVPAGATSGRTSFAQALEILRHTR